MRVRTPIVSAVSVAMLLVILSSPTFAQSANAKKIIPIILLLLDGDDCIKPLSIGGVVFDTLSLDCLSVVQSEGQYANYYSFSHTEM